QADCLLALAGRAAARPLRSARANGRLPQSVPQHLQHGLGPDGIGRDRRPLVSESGKVAGVVDAVDGGEPAAVPLDLVNAGGAEIQPVKGAKRDAESPAQHDLYRGNVTDYQDGLA